MISAPAWFMSALALLMLGLAMACSPAQTPASADPADLPTAVAGAAFPTSAPATALPTAGLSESATPIPPATALPVATNLPAATTIPLSPEGTVHSVGDEEAEAARTKFQRLLRASWDTDFTRSTISFNEIMTGGPPKDGIPAIDNPEFETVADADAWLDALEPVQVVDLNGDARAYPVQVMVWHEIVNDTVGDEPVVITF